VSIECVGRDVMACVEVACRDIVRQLDFVVRDNFGIAWPVQVSCRRRMVVAVPLLVVLCRQLVEYGHVHCPQASRSGTHRRHRSHCRSLVQVHSNMPITD
jgi:hypothetical protein